MKNIMKEKIIIVDKEDEIVWYKERGTLEKEDIYRVSALWIENSKGEILLTQRSFSKRNNPGQWQCAVAGTVDKWEDYDDNIYKETEEEIWVIWEKLKKLKKEYCEQNWGKYRFFCQRYYLLIDRGIEKFTIQEEEVEKIKWFKKIDLIEKIYKNPNDFSENILEMIKYFEDIK